jgi:hypothetical protein
MWIRVPTVITTAKPAAWMLKEHPIAPSPVIAPTVFSATRRVAHRGSIASTRSRLAIVGAVRVNHRHPATAALKIPVTPDRGNACKPAPQTSTGVFACKARPAGKTASVATDFAINQSVANFSGIVPKGYSA